MREPAWLREYRRRREATEAEQIPCARQGCKEPFGAVVVLERDGRPYCRPHGLALARKLPLSSVVPIDTIEHEENLLAEHIAGDVLTVCRGTTVNGRFVKGCGVMIVWAKTKGGKSIPLETEAIPRPAQGLVAYNPDTGGCHVLTREDVESGRAATWAGKWRMTFHRTHFATKRCPVVKARSQKSEQEAEAA